MAQSRVSFGANIVIDDDEPPNPLSTSSGVVSTDSIKSSSSGQKYTQLRESLTRSQTDRDPLFFYEVTKVLGEGSMGSVKLVKKRSNKVGGSARKELQQAVQRQKQNQECLNLPIIGGLFRCCIDGNLKDKDENPRVLTKMFSQEIVSSIRSVRSEDTGNGSIRSYESSNHQSDIIYAMKSIVISHLTEQAYIDELRNEIAILKKLDHPHIVRAIETFEHKKEIFIIMELCSGGDLYARDPYTEEQAARIVSSILSAVSYMHSKNIVHRDLKYENILFVNKSPTSEIKLIDFGLSKRYGDSAMTEGVGTIYTMAPEVLKGNYTQQADMWSIGVVTYMLLSSQLPFYGRKKNQIVEQVMNCRFDFKGRRWKRISNQAQEFIGDLLVLDPEERADADTALRSTWLNRRHAATTRAANEEEEEKARSSMLRYVGYSKLKKMALMVIAHKSSSEEIGILRKVFQKFDSRRDGSISFEEFCEVMSTFGYAQEDLKTMFDAVDLDGTGRIRYTEFLAATIEAHGAISEEKLAEAFDRLDSDDSGYISAENLIEILGNDIPQNEINAIIAEADLTKDNRISYSEFLALWETKQEAEKEATLRLIGADIETNGSVSFSRSESMDDESERRAQEARALTPSSTTTTTTTTTLLLVALVICRYINKNTTRLNRTLESLITTTSSTPPPLDKMGNCLGNDKDDNEKKEAAVQTHEISNGSHITAKKPSHQSVHGGILRERKLDVYLKYEVVQVLGEGSMGHVAKVRIREGTEGGSAFNPEKKGRATITRKSSTTSTLSERRNVKVDYALKMIQLDRVSPEYVEELNNEIDILKGLDHPNIVKAHEQYTYKKQIYIILELCDGGDLYTRLPYSEKRAAAITSKLIAAVKYMHDHGIVHRDLKFENIMFENKADDAEIKVIDFGLSKKFLDNKIGTMHEGVGTLYSMSPQVLQGVYSSAADLWSCGVISYMLLSSHRPFYHKRRKIMIDRIMRCDYSFEKDYWTPVSDEAKDFLNHLLVLDPDDRMDAGEALKHKWLSKEFPLSDRVPTLATSQAVQGNLIYYKHTSELKKIALNVIAHRSSSHDILELRKLFDQFDTANNGVISYEEFQTAMQQMDYTEAELESIFKSIDINQNGHIMYTEFIAAALGAQGHIEEERIAEAFDRLDSDDSGYISKQNLRDFLGKDWTNEEIKQMMKESDVDNDGKISYPEFLAMFRKQTQAKVMSQMISRESTVASDDGSLVGIDAKIPGGKTD
eukprot:Nitzschia sp. Nitz4//scaffold133_size116822//56256//65702//NITZ4_003807-RA/size116822-snap-gene-0.16-mRNA-1//-1//CDS//3329535396//9405//frame0